MQSEEHVSKVPKCTLPSLTCYAENTEKMDIGGYFAKSESKYDKKVNLFGNWNN